MRYASGPGRTPSREEAARARLFSPLKVGRLTLAQRTWVPAMVPWRATEDGFVSEEVIAWYARLARGRPGAIVVEATGVRDIPSGPLLRIGHDRYIPGLKRLVEAVRRESLGTNPTLHSDDRFPRHPPTPRARKILRPIPHGDAGAPTRCGRRRSVRGGGARASVRAGRSGLGTGSHAARIRVAALGLSRTRHGRRVAAHRRPAANAAAAVRRQRAPRPKKPVSMASNCIMRTPTRWPRSFPAPTAAKTATAAISRGGCGCRSKSFPRPAPPSARISWSVAAFLAEECIPGGSEIDEDDPVRRRLRACRHGFSLDFARVASLTTPRNLPSIPPPIHTRGRSGYECMPQFISDARGPLRPQCRGHQSDPRPRSAPKDWRRR